MTWLTVALPVGWAALVAAALAAHRPRRVRRIGGASGRRPVPPVLAGLGGPLRRARVQRAEARAWAEALPDAVDLFSVALGGGLVVPQAVELVGTTTPPPMGPALTAVAARVAHGAPLPDALERAAGEASALRPLVTILVAAHLDGVGAADALGRLAAELRLRGQREAETRARQVPVRMLFPLVGCTLPAFVLVTVVPSILTALSALHL